MKKINGLMIILATVLYSCGPDRPAAPKPHTPTPPAAPTATAIPPTDKPPTAPPLTATFTPSPEATRPTGPIVNPAGCQVSAPPANLNANPFYEKYCDAGGIPILSSAAVPDAALEQAWYIIMNMLAARPDIHQEIADRGTLFGIIGVTEVTTDLPEYAELNEIWPETNWDERARGLGATPFIRLSSSSEENLLCYASDRYIGESITVHEFAHTVLDMGLHFIDRGFKDELERLYDEAMAAGLWANTYATTNANEYWAEGVQSYFNANLEVDPPNGIHNNINTREELAEYDPNLYALIAKVFPAWAWTPGCP